MNVDKSVQFQLAVSGTGLLFTKTISYDQMRTITQYVLGDKSELLSEVSTDSKNQKPSIQEHSLPQTPVSLSVFVADSNAKRTPDKITVMAFYLWKEKNVTRFDKNDIKKLFEEALLSLPKNLNRDIGWAEGIGWIAKVPNQEGIYYITQEGIAAVEAKFPKKLQKKTVKGKV